MKLVHDSLMHQILGMNSTIIRVDCWWASTSYFINPHPHVRLLVGRSFIIVHLFLYYLILFPEGHSDAAETTVREPVLLGARRGQADLHRRVDNDPRGKVLETVLMTCYIDWWPMSLHQRIPLLLRMTPTQCPYHFLISALKKTKTFLFTFIT